MNPPSPAPPDRSPGPSASAEDLQGRYDRLSHDFQRIKSQNSILKKAVIQEQQKVVTLEKELREAEQKLRQHSEETDILQFNNQRLTKRLSVLQEELTLKSKEGGWRWGGSSRDLTKKTEELDVLRAELEEKIHENAQLHVDKRDLEEDIKQATELHSDQARVLKACVIAKQEEADLALKEVEKINQSLNDLHEEMEKQHRYFKESEEKLGREVQQIIGDINQSRKKFKNTIANPSATPPSPLTVWRDNKHTRELIGTFKDLYYAMEAHWDTHMDKITLLQDSNPPEQLANIYRELRSTIPSLSTQMTHISESLHQYLPVLFSKDGLPNLEFADTLHRFVNTCKKWLNYQKTRHMELSQQPGTSTPHAQEHVALAEIHSQVLRALDKLVADREVATVRGLASVLSSLSSHTRTLFTHEAEGAGEGGLFKKADGQEGESQESGREALIAVNERLLDTQVKTIALLEKFAAKLDEYESLGADSGRLQDAEDTHRLREIASHLIMLYNDISVALRDREMQHLSVQKDSDGLRANIRELENVISKKEGELKDQEARWNMTKDHVRVLTQETDTLRAEKLDLEKLLSEKQAQMTQEHERALASFKATIEASHAQALAAVTSKSQEEFTFANSKFQSDLAAANSKFEADLAASTSKFHSELSSLRVQLEGLQRTVEELQRELDVQRTRADTAETNASDELRRSESHRQDSNAQQGLALETQTKQAGELQRLRGELESKIKLVQELQQKLAEVEGSYRHEMAEKAQQVKGIQQKLMVQEARLEERTRQVQAAERLISEKEQLIAKLQKNPEAVDTTPSTPRNASEQLVSLMDSDVPPISEPEVGVNLSRPVVEDTTTPLTPTMSNKGGPKYAMTVVDEAGNQSNDLNASAVDKEREQALREYYESKMQQLTTQAKSADSKAVQLYEQYGTLLKTLEDRDADRNSLLDQIKTSNQAIKESKDDLESTRSNYDQQLRMLSELALKGEERAQSLEAENNMVKGCKVSCGKCKAWNSVEWLLSPDGKGGNRCVKGNHPLATFMT